MKTKTKKPDRQRDRAGADRVGAELRPDGAFLHHGQRRRQRAGAQQYRQIVGDAAVKMPLIWPRPPVIGSRITGAVITLSSSTMAKRWLTLARVISAKRRAPMELKVKLTTHSPVAVGAGPRVGQVAAIDLDPPAHRDLCRLVLHRQELTPGGGVGQRGLAVSSTRWKVMWAVLPSKSLIRLGS